MKHKYIIVKDSKNNYNIWQIVNEDINTYTILTRTTFVYIDKKLCKNKKGSSLLCFDNEKSIDINPSNIEYEKWSEYETYLLSNIYEEDLKV